MIRCPRPTDCSRSVFTRVALLAVVWLAFAGAGSSLADTALRYEPLEPETETYYELDITPKRARGEEFFQITGETRQINGVTAKVMKHVLGSHDGVESYYTNDEQGYRVHGQRTTGLDALDIVYDPPIVILPPTFAVDEVFITNVTLTNLGLAGMTLDVEHKTKILGYEPIHTPFTGTIQALKIRREINVSHLDAGSNGKKRVAWVWLAPGLGMVRSWVCDNKTNCNREFDNVLDGETKLQDLDHTLYAVHSNKTPVPEPGSVFQGIAAAAALAWLRRRRAHAPA